MSTVPQTAPVGAVCSTADIHLETVCLQTLKITRKLVQTRESQQTVQRKYRNIRALITAST